MSAVSRSKKKKQGRTIVLVTFETEFAPCGGLAAVMKILPKRLAKLETCFTIAPYFRNITGNKSVNSDIRHTGEEFRLVFGGKRETVRIRQHADDLGFVTYLLESERYFTAPSDPYINPGDPSRLLRDSLFFCAAAPKALALLCDTSKAVLHLQDWETASVVHTSRSISALESVDCLVTLHNPYDRGLSPEEASLIGAESLPGPSVLTKMLPFVRGPITTVSRNFADELTGDPLHAFVFADHLQPLFKSKGIAGVDNGLFGELKFPFSREAQREAERENFKLIQKEKWEKRIKLADRLGSYLKSLSGNAGNKVWGEGLELSDPKVPVFFLLGRDDPRQKGYDVASDAIRSIPKGKARYIFTPMPGDEGYDGLSFLRKLTEDRPGEAIVFPFRIDPDAFVALQSGCSYMVMCSLYEPFGGANEAYLAGMPVVARATGGLVQQVVPKNRGTLSPLGQRLVDRYHSSDMAPTGFLYREDERDDDIDGWRRIVDCAYSVRRPMGDRVSDRRGTPLFDRMTDGASRSLREAIELYTSDQLGYAEMIYNGYLILRSFSWDRAIRSYRRLYDDLCQP
jgi:glycogen synthase